MTYIIGSDCSDRGRRQAASWPGSVVAPQTRSFDPDGPTGHFKPAGERYRALSDAERDALIAELAVALSTCDPGTQARMIDGFTAIDTDYGRRVADALSGEAYPPTQQ